MATVAVVGLVGDTLAMDGALQAGGQGAQHQDSRWSGLEENSSVGMLGKKLNRPINFHASESHGLSVPSSRKRWMLRHVAGGTRTAL